MEPKRSKYDTNPLDEKVADKAEQSWGSAHPAPQTEEIHSGPTNDIARNPTETARANPESEAPTRRIDDNLGTSYPSIFVQPPPRQSAAYQPPRAAPMNIYQPPPVPPPNIYLPPPLPVTIPSSRIVPGINISEKWTNVLPYAPFYIGAVAALIELLLVPRTETRARFHAAQGLALHIAITLILILFQVMTVVTGTGVGAGLFKSAAFIFLIVSMVRVGKGKPHHIAPLDEPTKWLEAKIKPRK
jgi:uncharacterized membrane protein